MIKKKVSYIDFNDEQITEDFYFHISKAEFLSQSFEKIDGLSVVENLEKIVQEKDNAKILKYFTGIIEQAYGEKSADGKSFIKDKEKTKAFVGSEAFSELIMEFFQNPDSMIEFIKGVFPRSLLEEVDLTELDKLKSEVAI